ncbi:urate hydroxylase PuuD [Vibrio olivae]
MAWPGLAQVYFAWLDNSLETPPKWKQDKGIKGDLWSVHGGGFYEIAKYKVGPEQMPEKLHWFKWEAYTTWITGSTLMIWMYYFNAQAYLIDPRVMDLSSFQAVAMGIGGVLLGVVVYEILMRSPLSKSSLAFVSAIIVFGTLFFYGFTHIFSGRGAFIHMGALIGSIMANNVFHKIIPGQHKMVKQVAAGEPVDPAPGLEGKRRSIHNNYFTLPVIFLMISNHYPMIYQHSVSWLVGMLIMLISAYIRHYFNLKHSGQQKPDVLVYGATAMFLLAIVISWQATEKMPTAITVEKAPVETDARQLSMDHPKELALHIINKRCSTCHSANPTDDIFKAAPSGVQFDTWQDIERWKSHIITRAVDNGDMPFMNKTEMTDQERQELKQALSQIQ